MTDKKNKNFYYYLKKLDGQVKENSNMTYSIQGLNNYISSAISKNYWLNKIYTPEIKQAHENGDIHIHDLNIISTYCVGWDLKDLLTEGFTGVDGKVKCAPPKHFRTALGQIVNFLYTMQGEAAGAQAFSNFDTLLAPFVRYDKLDYAQVKQAMQEFVFNLNVPTRTGFQTPFTNITMDLTVPSYYADASVIIGGELKEETYKEFQKEMNLINKAYFEVMMQGDYTGKVFTFPIPTYNITKDFDWENPELDGLWEMTAKYGIPYFSNFVNSDMKPEDARSMCCRLRIDNRELEYRGGGLFGSNPLTGSIGVVTINLPRIGYLAQNEAEFFQMLCRNMELARESLEIKREVVEEYTDKNLYPYTKFYLRDIKARFGVYWKNHFSTIGLVGMNEACENLLGKSIGTGEGKEFALKARRVRIESIEYCGERDGGAHAFRVTCGGGTYIRSIARDMAQALGTYGYMRYIRRERSGIFTIENAYTVDELESGITDKMIPVENVLNDFPRYDCPSDEVARVLNGVKVNLVGMPEGIFRLYCDGMLTGLAENDNGTIEVKTRLI